MPHTPDRQPGKRALRAHRVPRTISLLVALAALARCGDSPTEPLPPANSAPIIRGMTVSATIVEAGQEVSVTAQVEDNETPVDSLGYQWTAPGGSFTGQGRSVRWTSPADGPVPNDYMLTVTVTETYAAREGGRTVQAQHRVSASSEPIRVNDRFREMRALAETFLVDFADSTKSAEYCVRNFTSSCPGKAEELADITRDRNTYEIVAEQHRIDSIEFDYHDPTVCTGLRVGWDSCALVIAPVVWISRHRQTGVVGPAIGDSYLTGVYENKQWWLCDSRFFGRPTSMSRPTLR